MPDEKSLAEKSDQELKSEIAELTIKIAQQEKDKKADADNHNDIIRDLKSEQTEVIDELLSRR